MTVFAYDNFDLTNPGLTMGVIIWGVWAGIIIGALCSLYSRDYLGSIVRALIKNQCTAKESAATFEDLGIKPNLLFKRALRDGSVLRKYICIENPEECTLPQKKYNAFVKFFAMSDISPKQYDLAKAKLYIPEDKKHTADIRYEKKRGGLLLLLIGLVVSIGVAIAATFLIPKALELLDDVITMFKGFFPN